MIHPARHSSSKVTQPMPPAATPPPAQEDAAGTVQALQQALQDARREAASAGSRARAAELRNASLLAQLLAPQSDGAGGADAPQTPHPPGGDVLAELAQARRDAAMAQSELAAVYRSTSWRSTALLRAIRRRSSRP